MAVNKPSGWAARNAKRTGVAGNSGGGGNGIPTSARPLIDELRTISQQGAAVREEVKLLRSQLRKTYSTNKDYRDEVARFNRPIQSKISRLLKKDRTRVDRSNSLIRELNQRGVNWVEFVS